MSRRAKDALIGLVYLVVIAALVALSILVYNHAFTSYVTVSARTDHVGSALQEGSDVTVRGIPIGTVSGTSTDGDGAVVHLDLDPAQAHRLPANVTVRLLPKTLFGERYVALQFPIHPDGKHLSSGDTIYQDRSFQAVELNRLFQDLLPVLQAVQPDKLAAMLGQMARTLRGNGRDIYRAMSAVTTFVQGFTPEVPQLAADLDAFRTVAGTYTQAAPDLLQALDSMTTFSQTVVRQRSDLQSLLTSVTTMSDTVRGFVAANRQQIIGLAAQSLPSLQILRRYAGEFPCLSRTLADYVPIGNQAFGAGTSQPGAHIVLHVVPRVGPYTAADAPKPYTDAGAPRCPYTPATSLAATALAQVPGVTGANHADATASTAASTTASSTTSTTAADGLGPANSPQENELIAELVAPGAGLRPSQFPGWSSLLLGPALRGTAVTLR